jgi:aryl-alcohol dehydrogenase-like predicted oxidoreductase
MKNNAEDWPSDGRRGGTAPATPAASCLALGTVQFGQSYGIANSDARVSLDTAREILSVAFSIGIDTIDTAVAYGDSESRLGTIGVADWDVITKLPTVPRESVDVRRWVDEQVRASLRRLRLSCLRGVLVHNSGELASEHGDELYQSMHEVKASGLVEKIGVSIYDARELDLLTSRYDLDIVQAPLNVFDRRIVESGWLSRLSDSGTEVHVRSVFLQGLLLMAEARRPAKFARWSNLWTIWDAWLRDHDISALDACIAFVMAHAGVRRIVVGVDSVAQLREIRVAADAAATAAIVAPVTLRSDDVNLINPSRWSDL